MLPLRATTPNSDGGTDSDSEGRGYRDPASSSSDTSSDGEQSAVDALGPCCSETGDIRELEFGFVLKEEQDALLRRRLVRGSCSKLGRPFSVCFSGGGVRAASFQAGVLWQMASLGVLKDVEYFVAVSGGAYIASGFISHVVEGGRPEPGENVDAWYLGRAAEAIVRMQRNISYLVRDAFAAPLEVPKDGSSFLPRIFDLPILLISLIFTILTFPLTFTIMALVPFTEIVNLFFGSVARKAFCAPPSIAPWSVIVESERVRVFLCIAGGMFAVSFVVFVLWKCMPCCRRLPTPPGGRPPPNLIWLFGHSTLAALTRVVFLIVMTMLIVIVFTDAEIWAYDMDDARRQDRRSLCDAYITRRRIDSRGLCGDLETSVPWYNQTQFIQAMAAQNLPGQSVNSAHPYPTPGFVRTLVSEMRLSLGGLTTSLMKATSLGLVALMLAGIFLQPFFEGLFAKVLFIIGPLVLFMLSVGFVRWRVFSPITGQQLQPVLYRAFDQTSWDSALFWTYLLDVLIVPMYQGVRGTMHRFYSHALQRAYFAGGRDTTWNEIKANMFCPFLLLTGTVNDYVRVDDDVSIHEISFSALHTGSKDLGYVRARRPQSLAKCTALTGAATDAFILGMLDRIRYRFWLEVLNLCMGDFIPFRRRERPLVKAIRRTVNAPPQCASQFVYRLPSAVLGSLFYALMLASVCIFDDDATTTVPECNRQWTFVCSGIALFMLSLFLSFYGFLPCFKFLLHSPGIRQLHQLTRYYHRASRPPNLIYVTDGGVQDCTGIMQLMQRRCERILLVMGAEDPKSELLVLRATIEMCAKAKLGAFYDPSNPRRDVRAALDEFMVDTEAVDLHLGIQYGWREDYGTGHLFIVKNRLPMAFQDRLVAPLLTEEEIRGTGAWHGSDNEVDPWGKHMKQSELGACCCDCCHAHHLDCGTRFPHVPNANQCMTPQMFNSLCRLGFELSLRALQAISTPGPVCEVWEDHVTPSASRAPSRMRTTSPAANGLRGFERSGSYTSMDTTHTPGLHLGRTPAQDRALIGSGTSTAFRRSTDLVG